MRNKFIMLGYEFREVPEYLHWCQGNILDLLAWKWRGFHSTANTRGPDHVSIYCNYTCIKEYDCSGVAFQPTL